MTTCAFIAKYIRPDHRCLNGTALIRLHPQEELTLKSVKKEPGLVSVGNHVLTNIVAYITFETTAYLGKLNEVKSYFVKKDVERGNEEVWIPASSIANLSDDLPFFADAGAVPAYLFKGGFQTYSIDLRDAYPRKGLFELESARTPFLSRYGDLTQPSGKWIAIHTSEDIYAEPNGSNS